MSFFVRYKKAHLICYGLRKFAKMYLGSLTCGWDANPVIFIFKLGLVRKSICEVVGFNIEDGIDTIEAGIEGRLWQKKKISANKQDL